MIYPAIAELAADTERPVPIAAVCRVLGVSVSGYYEWQGHAAEVWPGRTFARRDSG